VTRPPTVFFTSDDEFIDYPNIRHYTDKTTSTIEEEYVNVWWAQGIIDCTVCISDDLIIPIPC